LLTAENLIFMSLLRPIAFHSSGLE
jgi:hypothetical protein